ncbi:P-II family nitrogen regulator [Propionispora hippei]|uniref:Nitrogen regulatory protein P-II family n=1 Tax=Propionispora hippei DSM 15287 TaxID=1123003 RepID=A0A1M6CWE9_9FIRM|nr:P-II family nitrogen regulator [Propionispora hippei]SHI65213.1 nitrogen regulatory protein P-II family [Propionispora hippei DSM 15287]
MIMIRAIIRPEKRDEVLNELAAGGFNAATVLDVVGRGKQKGIKLAGVVYDEIPKTMIIMVVRAADQEAIANIILQTAKSGDQGLFGDGKIFVSPVEEVYTISSGKTGL